jgi:hypothetical protein
MGAGCKLLIYTVTKTYVKINERQIFSNSVEKWEKLCSFLVQSGKLSQWCIHSVT